MKPSQNSNWACWIGPNPDVGNMDKRQSLENDAAVTAEDEQSTSEPGIVEASVDVWTAHQHSAADSQLDVQTITDKIAEETAVALVYNDLSHAVMMVSPTDLEAFAIGFSLTEGIIESSNDIYDLQLIHGAVGIEVKISVSNQCFAGLKDRRRSLTGRTGCGICGAESLQQIRLPVKLVTGDCVISHAAIQHATQALADNQPIQSVTGAVHGAAWCDPDGTILQLCEDVGRHNALDKLVGRMCQEGLSVAAGFLLISSRASYEVVQKAAMAGMPVVVAVSAPTTMALEVAQQANISLVGFSSAGRHVVYTNSQRLTQV